MVDDVRQDEPVDDQDAASDRTDYPDARQPAGDVTQILSAIEQGDRQAAEQLLPLVYDVLRQLAAARMAREKPGQTLDATGLVHEAYLRVVDGEPNRHWNSRGHFYSAAAEAMRRILIENARRKLRDRHGGGRQQIDIEDVDLAGPTANWSQSDLLALDEVLARFAASEPMKAKLVQLRFFGGLGNDQAAEILGISAPTAKRYWRYARAWLHSALCRDEESV